MVCRLGPSVAISFCPRKLCLKCLPFMASPLADTYRAVSTRGGIPSTFYGTAPRLIVWKSADTMRLKFLAIFSCRTPCFNQRCSRGYPKSYGASKCSQGQPDPLEKDVLLAVLCYVSVCLLSLVAVPTPPLETSIER